MEHWWNDTKRGNRRTRRKIVPIDRRVFSISTSVFRCHYRSINAPCPYLIYQPLTPLISAIAASRNALFWVATQLVALSIYRYSLSNNNPEENISQLLSGGSLKSRTISSSLIILLSLFFSTHFMWVGTE
jgi:hypothetical protein